MKTLEDSLKEIWVNKLTSIKEKRLKSCSNCVKGKEILNILDNNNIFWIKWYELIKKDISSFYLDLRIIDLKENGIWYEVTFDIGQDIIMKESPDEIQRVRGERYFAKLKKQENEFYLYTLKEIMNNKLCDIERLSAAAVEEIYKKYVKISQYSMVKKNKEKAKYEYKRNSAICYAYRFNRFRNRYYPFLCDNNSTSYISQCLCAGGISQRKSYWYCRPKVNGITTKIEDYEITKSWYDFEEFYKLIIQSQIGNEESCAKDLIIGDIVQAFSTREMECKHTMLVTKVINDEIYITSQYMNKSYMDYPLYLLFPTKKINKYRFISVN